MRLPAWTYARMAFVLIAAVALFAAASIPFGLAAKTLFLLPTLIAFSLAAWFYLGRWMRDSRRCGC